MLKYATLSNQFLHWFSIRRTSRFRCRFEQNSGAQREFEKKSPLRELFHKISKKRMHQLFLTTRTFDVRDFSSEDVHKRVGCDRSCHGFELKVPHVFIEIVVDAEFESKKLHVCLSKILVR